MYLISACLCGCRCTYKGTDNLRRSLADIYNKGGAVLVCPEKLGGLSVPRLPCEIVGGDGMAVLEGKAKVLNEKGQDVTLCFINGAKKSLALAQDSGVELAILKSRSPSCGVGKIYDGTFSGRLREGDGVTAALLRISGIPVINDEDFLGHYQSRPDDLRVK